MKATGIADDNGGKAPVLDFPQRRVALFYIFACGILWRKDANRDAGRELVQGLASPNAMIRRVAKSMLDERRNFRYGAESRRRSPPLASSIAEAGKQTSTLKNLDSKSEERSMIPFR